MLSAFGRGSSRRRPPTRPACRGVLGGQAGFAHCSRAQRRPYFLCHRPIGTALTGTVVGTTAFEVVTLPRVIYVAPSGASHREHLPGRESGVPFHRRTP